MVAARGFIPGSCGYLRMETDVSWLWQPSATRIVVRSWLNHRPGNLPVCPRPPCYLVLGHLPGKRLWLLDTWSRVWDVDLQELRLFTVDGAPRRLDEHDDLNLSAP
jgi:hypothetical protein